MTSNLLSKNEYPDIYSIYIDLMPNAHLIEELEISLHDFIRFVQNTPMDKFDFRYSEEKWTIKEIIQHLIDTERILSYRALRFARNDKTVLHGFDQNEYAKNTNSDRSIQDLLTELSAVRHSTLYLFKSFKEEQLLEVGNAAGYNFSVRAIGFIIIGHMKHHQKIFKERYL